MWVTRRERSSTYDDITPQPREFLTRIQGSWSSSHPQVLLSIIWLSTPNTLEKLYFFLIIFVLLYDINGNEVHFARMLFVDISQGP